MTFDELRFQVEQENELAKLLWMALALLTPTYPYDTSEQLFKRVSDVTVTAFR